MVTRLWLSGVAVATPTPSLSRTTVNNLSLLENNIYIMSMIVAAGQKILFARFIPKVSAKDVLHVYRYSYC